MGILFDSPQSVGISKLRDKYNAGRGSIRKPALSRNSEGARERILNPGNHSEFHMFSFK